MKLVNGWLDQAIRVPSPNFDRRPEDSTIDLLVIHNISLPPGQFGLPYIEQLFQNCLSGQDHPYFEAIHTLKVSAHFLIKRTGEIMQFVSCFDRAWHAGQSVFCGRENCNNFSLGIELEGDDVTPYENAQYLSLIRLTQVLQASFPLITADRIVGHSDIAPGRKTDPGASFDWAGYRAQLSPKAC